jgi:dynein heavy chain, axonemal
MASLGSERENWLTAVRTLSEEQAALLGDMVLASCVVTYLGPFEASYRQRLVTGSWRELIAQTSSIPASPHFDLRDAIGDVERIQRWQLCGIPNDSVSTENMILLEVTEAERWPLLIDPQEQALAFMREYLEHDYILIKASSEHISRTMEYALGRGAAVIYENVGELEGPAALLSLLGREVYHIAGGRYIKFDDNQVEYHDDFRLLMFTGHSNPRFSPAIQSKVQLLNFSITQEGLQAQLLSLVCKSECQKEEDEKHRLHRQDLEFRRQKSEIEREILKLLREAGDDVLEDDTLLHSLDESKRITDDISHKLLSAKHLGDRIEASRKAFRPVAVHGARLFFAI